ncbi:MAG: hypothetical protein R2741_07090 [Methanolobus sp.]
MNVAPAFGGNPTSEQKEAYEQLSNYADGHFVNELPTSVFVDSSETPSSNDPSGSEVVNRDPANPIPVSTD